MHGLETLVAISGRHPNRQQFDEGTLYIQRTWCRRKSFSATLLFGLQDNVCKMDVPENKETIENYATRLIDQITTTKPTLIGLSFGGLIAVEVAKQIDTEKIILISSAKTKNEIPFYYRLPRYFRLYKLFPTRLLKRSNALTNWFFGTSSTFDKKLLK